MKKKSIYVVKKCLTCNIVFEVQPCRKDTAKFCSDKCRFESYKGKVPSYLGGHGQIEKSCVTCGSKFTCVPSNKKAFCSRDCYWQNMKGKPSGRKGEKRPNYTEEKHHMWKGERVGYVGLHTWVKKHLGRPNTCQECGKTGLTGHKIHWANKSGKYLRDLNDWIRLCALCHGKFDGTTFKKGYIPWNKGIKMITNSK